MDFFMEDFRSHILFIPGIFVEDCNLEKINNNYMDFSMIKPENIDLIEEDENFSDIEDEDESQISKELKLDELLDSYEVKENIIYDTIPKYFINNNSWIKTTNLLCCYCHDKIKNTPMPIALGKNKILIPENDDINETIISLTDKVDDHLLFCSQTMKEVIAYKIHNVLCCDISCVGNYIRKVTDLKIINKRESIQMSISIYKEIIKENIEDIPEKDLWIVMEQYCGSTGQKRSEYREKNLNKEIKLKLAMKII